MRGMFRDLIEISTRSLWIVVPVILVVLVMGRPW